MKILTLTASSLLVGSLLVSPAYAWDYIIEESMDYTGNGCASWDLNNVTSYLDGVLDDDGRVGFRIYDNAIWPQDWWESCSGTYGSGFDSSYADTALLAVYAGHGHKGSLDFGFKKSGACFVDLGSNMRLGSMSGNEAGYAMLVSSCTLATTHLVSDANFQWVRQQLGFHNSPEVDDGAPGWFYEHTGVPYSYSNSYAWNSILEEDMYGDEVNSPIVVSYGTTLSEAQSVRDTAKLRNNTWVSDRSGGPACGGGQPSFHFLYVMTNNGDC